MRGGLKTETGGESWVPGSQEESSMRKKTRLVLMLPRFRREGEAVATMAMVRARIV